VPEAQVLENTSISASPGNRLGRRGAGVQIAPPRPIESSGYTFLAIPVRAAVDEIVAVLFLKIHQLVTPSRSLHLGRRGSAVQIRAPRPIESKGYDAFLYKLKIHCRRICSCDVPQIPTERSTQPIPSTWAQGGGRQIAPRGVESISDIESSSPSKSRAVPQGRSNRSTAPTARIARSGPAFKKRRVQTNRVPNPPQA
jgi:hypothetical protein